MIDGLRDTLAGVSILTGLVGLFHVVNGEHQFLEVFVAHAAVLGIGGLDYAAIGSNSSSVLTVLSILPLLGLSALVLPERTGLVVVSVLLLIGGLSLSLQR